MTDDSEINVQDSVVMGSILNNSQIYNLIITTNPQELADKIEEIVVPAAIRSSENPELKITLKSQIEDFKQKYDNKILPTRLAEMLVLEDQSQLNDPYLQRVIAQDIHESWWTLFGNLMLKKEGDNWYSQYHLEDNLLAEAIDSTKHLCLSALKMNSEPFGILCKARSMSALCVISALDDDTDLAEKYGIEAINLWEKYGDDYFENCGHPSNNLPIMSEYKLDIFYEYMIIYGAYHGILYLEKPSESRIRKFLRHFDAHPISIFSCTIDSSAPMWTVVSGLSDFSNLSNFEEKKHYEYWAMQAKIQNMDEDLMILQEMLKDFD